MIRLVRWVALAVGVVLFVAALSYINVELALGTIRRLGVALPLALFFSGLWHLARTWAWAWCFPQPRTIGFLRLARVRLSAEAFSYLTLRGIAGEPLKVVLLADRVTARDATAAVALERLAYLVGTTVIVGIGSVAAIVGLPLTRIWFRVFRAFAIVAVMVAVLTTFVISGRGTYLQSFLRRLDAWFGLSISSGRVSRFAAAVETQVLELVRGNPIRLLVLLTATLLSYVLMALEAWVILRASGAPITPNGALAVETFSRVASFASAFIPANLGALEASSLAAVTAVGAVGGGVALAVARRLRGLFWAGLGLAIYPRKAKPARWKQREAPTPPLAGASPPDGTLLYLPHDGGIHVSPTTRLAGLPLAERVIRAAARAGYGRIIVWTGGVPPKVRGLLRELASSVPGVILASSEVQWQRALVERAGTSSGAPFADGSPARSSDIANPFTLGTDLTATSASPAPVTVVGPGTVVSPALLALARTIEPASGEVRDVPAGPEWRVSGVLRLTAGDARDRGGVAAALAARRERALPLPTGRDVADGRAALALRVVSEGDVRAAEATIRRSSYKDTDNTVAQFNRRLSLPISVALIRTPLTANQLSLLLVTVGFSSAWLFSLGRYWTGVLAALLSLAASVLDGCDGEIARLKYQESALGCWIETFGDYSYYIAIFIGLTIGAVRQTHVQAFYGIGGLAVGGTLLVFVFLIYLRTRITSGRPERLHAIAKERFQAEPTLWSRVAWRLSFTATRSAMPYGILAFSLVSGLPAIVVLAAIGANVYWASLALKLKHLLRNEQAIPATPTA